MADHANPYESPTASSSGHRSRTSPWYLPGAIAAFAFAFIVAGPGMTSLSMRLAPQSQPGRRYVTYDPELFFFGASVTPETARWLSFTIAPALLSLGIVLVRAWWRSRKSPGLADGE